MKLLTFCSDSHVGLLRDFFMPSFYAHPEGFDSLVIARMEQVCPSGGYKTPGWDHFFRAKINRVIEELENTKDGDFLFLIDCDVQWFGSTNVSEYSAFDLIGQQDGTGGFCPGIARLRAGYSMRSFWKLLLERVSNSDRDEQFSINDLLETTTLHCGYFHPDQVWSTRSIWKLGDPIPEIPKGIVAHHANWTHSVADKVGILTAVRNAVLSR